MCKKLMRTVAEAEADAAASILVEISTNASSKSTSWPGAVGTAMAPITTKMPEIVAKDEPLAAAAESSGKIRALCAVAKLVHSTVHLVSLRVRHNEAYGGLRQADDALVEGLAVPQPESLDATPQPDAVVAPVVPEPAGGDVYKHRHSWRRRRSAAVIAAASDDAPVAEGGALAENALEPAGDVYKHRHSWRRRSVPVVVAASEDASVTEEGDLAESVQEPAGDVYKHRHSWRRRSAPVVVAATDDAPVTEEGARAENGPEAASDVYKHRHSWRRRSAPVVVAVTDDAPATEVASVVRSTGRPRAPRIRVVVAGSVVGVCVAALVTNESVDENDDDHHADLPTLHVAESTREGWQERRQRRGRGERYAAFMTAALTTTRRRHGGGRRRA
jgi:hypothetical protein